MPCCVMSIPMSAQASNQRCCARGSVPAPPSAWWKPAAWPCPANWLISAPSSCLPLKLPRMPLMTAGVTATASKPRSLICLAVMSPRRPWPVTRPGCFRSPPTVCRASRFSCSRNGRRSRMLRIPTMESPCQPHLWQTRCAISCAAASATPSAISWSNPVRAVISSSGSTTLLRPLPPSSPRR